MATSFGTGTAITARALNTAFAELEAMIVSGAAAAGSLTGNTLASNVIYSSLTSVGTITSGTWSGSFGAVSGANLTSLNASNLASGTVPSARLSGAYTGITGLGTLTSTLNGTTIFASDYLQGGGVNFNSYYNWGPWSSGNSGGGAAISNDNGTYKALMIVGNNSAGGVRQVKLWDYLLVNGSCVATTFTTNNASPSLELGDWASSASWSAVDGYNGYLLMGNTSDRACYLRTWTDAPIYIGRNQTNTLMVNNGNIVVNGSTANSTLNVIGGTAWFSAMGAGSGATVVNNFGFLQYVSSRIELKENIVTVNKNDALNRVLSLRPVDYSLKPEFVQNPNELTPFDRKRGFIAQEVCEVDHWYGEWGWVDEQQRMQTENALEGSLPLEEATPIYWSHDAMIADLVSCVQLLEERIRQLEMQ